MRMRVFFLLRAAIITICFAGFARAEVAGYDKTENMISMRDGVKLHTVIYRPKKQDGPLPIVLMRTPYGVDQGAPRALGDYLKDMADDGYLFAFQDIRG